MKRTLLKGLLFLCVLSVVFAVGTSAQAQTAQEDAYIQAVKQTSHEIIVAMSEVNKSWERAKSYIAKYSDTKSPIVSDFIIDTNSSLNTYGAAQAECKFTYSILKVKRPDGTYKITVECNCIKGKAEEIAKNNAKILSYYIKTGELIPKFVNNL